MTRILKWALLCCFILIAACGRTLPVADELLVQSKKAVLVITASSLDPNAVVSLQKVLKSWKETDLTTYELIPETTSLDDEILSRILSKPYDYIIVIGNQLLQQASIYAEQAGRSKWVLLENAYSYEPSQSEWGRHTMLFAFPNDWLRQYWNGTILNLTRSGAVLAWVTDGRFPIPVVWAPSEEAETIIDTDLYRDTWFDQLSFLVKNNKPGRIVVCTPQDEERIARIGSLGVPVADLSKPTVSLDWDRIYSLLEIMMEKDTWQASVNAYPLEIISR
jgi:hypothetical protein